MTNPYPEWEYRVDIDISNPSSTDGFQAKIDISFLSGMQPDFDDIRFASLSDVVVPYWIESKTDSTEATVWLKLPASASNVYMYYGNDAASSESSGADVFEIFDDFENSTIFDESTVSTSYVTGRTGQAIKIDGGSSASYLTKNQTISRDKVIEAWVRIPSGNSVTSLGGLVIGRQSGNTGYNTILDERSGDSTQSDMQIRENYSSSSLLASYNSKTIQTETWYFARTTWESDGSITYAIYEADGTLWASISANDTSYTSGHCGICAYNYMIVDEFRIREYTASEPTLSVNESSIVDNGIGVSASSLSFVSCGIAADPISESGASQSSSAAIITEYITVDVVSQSSTGTPSVDDSIPITVAGISGVGNFPLKDYIQLNNYNIETVDISRSISDSMWELTANIENVNTPNEYSHIDFSAVDADGTTQQMFTGLIPSSRYVLQAAANKSSVTAYDYGFYLSKQKVSYSELTMDLNGSYSSWDAWVTHLLDNTGIDAYKINSCSAGDKEFKLNADTPKLEALKQIAEHAGFIFYVGWINYGTTENPDLRPSAYFVDVDDIDDAVNGLDLPAACTVTWPDDYLASVPLMDSAVDEDYNRVIVRGMNSGGTWYTATSETSAVTAGDEYPREYYEESADWNTQAKADARASALLTYFTEKVYKVQANFQKRFDLKLWQKIQFTGAGFPAALTDMGWLRIVSIRYHHAPAYDTVTIEALPDRDMNFQVSRIDAVAGDGISETELMIDSALNERPQTTVGTVTEVGTYTCTIETEDGNTVTARIIQ